MRSKSQLNSKSSISSSSQQSATRSGRPFNSLSSEKLDYSVLNPNEFPTFSSVISSKSYKVIKSKSKFVGSPYSHISLHLDLLVALSHTASVLGIVSPSSKFLIGSLGKQSLENSIFDLGNDSSNEPTGSILRSNIEPIAHGSSLHIAYGNSAVAFGFKTSGLIEQMHCSTANENENFAHGVNYDSVMGSSLGNMYASKNSNMPSYVAKPPTQWNLLFKKNSSNARIFVPNKYDVNFFAFAVKPLEEVIVVCRPF